MNKKELKLREKELLESIEEHSISTVNERTRLYRKDQLLKVDEEVLEYKEELVKTAEKCANDTANLEHKFHSAQSEKNTELAKLDVAIDHKRVLLEELKDVRETEIKVLKDLHSVAINDKNRIIELLTTQIEILTAKLTEIKVTDLHLNADVKVNSKE